MAVLAQPVSLPLCVAQVPMSHRQPDRVARRLSTSFSSFPSSSTTPRLSTSSSAVPSTASSSAMSIARSSSSSSSASLPPSTVSKPAPLPRCFLRADAEDLNYLYDEMVGKKESKPFLGFGKGFVLFPPAEWEPCQRLRLRNFCCDTLGFEAKTHDGRVYLQLGTKKVPPTQASQLSLSRYPLMMMLGVGGGRWRS